jgi:hypothetical protein
VTARSPGRAGPAERRARGQHPPRTQADQDHPRALVGWPNRSPERRFHHEPTDAFYVLEGELTFLTGRKATMITAGASSAPGFQARTDPSQPTILRVHIGDRSEHAPAAQTRASVSCVNSSASLKPGPEIRAGHGAWLREHRHSSCTSPPHTPARARTHASRPAAGSRPAIRHKCASRSWPLVPRSSRAGDRALPAWSPAASNTAVRSGCCTCCGAVTRRRRPL